MPKLLIIELWGLGDLTMMTPFLRAACSEHNVTLLAKTHAKPLLAETFPTVSFLSFDAPWTAFRDKYNLWRWNWSRLGAVIQTLRRAKFDLAVSARGDVRDHFLMVLAGIRNRAGIAPANLPSLLTQKARRSREPQHRTEDWADLWRLINPGSDGLGAPKLSSPPAEALPDELREFLSRQSSPPVLAVHLGARIGVRRWPIPHFQALLKKIRRKVSCRILLIPDTDDFGAELAGLADYTARNLGIRELCAALARCGALLCNDSGPSHIADALGVPVCAIFGPSHPVRFRPFNPRNLVIDRDICPFRPCFDYCRFREPYCMTKLTPDLVESDVIAFLNEHLPASSEGALPETGPHSGANP